MKILLTNDDGIYANGLCSLYETLSIDNDVVIVAPDSEKSAVGHAITIADPLRVRLIKKNGQPYGWAVNGTPADCVKLALYEIINDPVDIVISGINRGANVGINVLYSGTVSAATEAAILGVRSVAVSLNSFADQDYCFPSFIISQLLPWIINQNITKQVALNINIPAVESKKIKGIKFVKQDIFPYHQRFRKNIDPRGNIYYWQDGEIKTNHHNSEIDIIALNEGYITITPIKYDLTCYNTLQTISLPEINI
jgi:5'-nucleotidase